MRLLLYSCFVLLSFGCGAARPEPAPVGTARPASGLSFLALGDSYTIGEKVSASDRWCRQLAELAQAENLQAPRVIARTGWTTADLQLAIDQAKLPQTYELVSLLIGVNNQYQGQPLTVYRAELRDLLQTSIRLAAGRPGRVLVLSVPDWGQSPYAQGRDRTRIGQQIDQFNAVARQESQLAGVTFVDITDLTRAAAPDPTQFMPDGLHYSGRQMHQWAERALPVVRGLLR